MRLIGLYLDAKYEVCRSNRLWDMNTGSPNYLFDLDPKKKKNPSSCFTIIPSFKKIGKKVFKLSWIEKKFLKISLLDAALHFFLDDRQGSKYIFFFLLKNTLSYCFA